MAAARLANAGIAAVIAVVATACQGSTVTAPTGSAPVAVTANPSPADWTTYMGDTMRSGVGPATPRATSPHRTWTAKVDGDVYAEPLVAGLSVIVATEQDTIYALNAATGAVRWRQHLGDPVPLRLLECGNIDPNGITSTPTLDTAAGLVYAVAMLNSPIRHELFALKLSDGSIVWHRVVDPPGEDPGHQQQRGSLNLFHSRVYFSWGGFTGDCGNYHGWVIAAPTDGNGPLLTWQVPSVNRGAIWAPPGPVISSDGNVWVTTGDTNVQAQEGVYDGANAVVRLNADLSPIDQWASKEWRYLNQYDIDQASMAPALLSDGLVFITGKEGVGFLLRAAHLGGIGGESFNARACKSGGPALGAFGGAAVAAGLVFVPCKDGLAALRIDASKPSFTLAWEAAPYANSAIFAYGLVWTVASDAGTYRGNWKGTLYGLDPTNGAVRAQLPLGPIPHYPSPAAAGGSLYVAGLGVVYAVSVS
jgi:outer membrane protein assembly factor BamB